VGLGMFSMESAVIMLLVVLSMVSQYVFLRIYVRIMNQSMIVLDQNIDQGIKSNLENLPETLGVNITDGIEPLNPIQQVVADFLRERMSPDIQVKEIQRAVDGKFT